MISATVDAEVVNAPIVALGSRLNNPGDRVGVELHQPANLSAGIAHFVFLLGCLVDGKRWRSPGMPPQVLISSKSLRSILGNMSVTPSARFSVTETGSASEPGFPALMAANTLLTIRAHRRRVLFLILHLANPLI